MLNGSKKLKSTINRRQFIRKVVKGCLGVGAILATYKTAFSFTNNGLSGDNFELKNRKHGASIDNDNEHFLKEDEYQLVVALAALIIPTDEDPGANEAGVVDYIDTIVSKSEKKQALYSNGLKWLDDFSQKKYGTGKSFLKLKSKEQNNLLNLIYSTLYQPASGLLQRLSRKINTIYDEYFVGIGRSREFFRMIRKDVTEGYYSNPVSWGGVGYFGAPNPVGYPDYSDPPSPTHYSDTIRHVNNTACKTCHERGEHPRGGLIDHSCTTCHRPHSPWPYDKEAFYLEDQMGLIFPNPDRKKGDG